MSPATTHDSVPARADVVVIGAGFGGLSTALTLAEAGVDVVLCEALGYPGGCASTFKRGGIAYESGATLFSGFGKDQLFRRWIDRHQLDVEVDWLDPLVVSRSPDVQLAVSGERSALEATFGSLPGAPVAAIKRFFRLQRRVADTLWEVLDDPQLLPPLGLSSLARHAGRLHRYAPLLRLMGRPVRDVLERTGVAGFSPLVTFLDALCQITVQCGVDEAEAPLALATMDYYFRGTAHVRGGIGRLAEALLGAIGAQGGRSLMSTRVKAVSRREEGRFTVETRRGNIDAGAIVANMLPQDLRRLCAISPGDIPRLDALATAVETGWGAAMLYLVVEPPTGFDAPAMHLDLVADPSLPMIEGNHVFCSVGEAHADTGRRSVTVSTHVRVDETRSPRAETMYMEAVQDAMRDTLDVMAPEWSAAIISEMTASPRTFERFTRRHRGYVGGVPRRAGLHNYRALAPTPIAAGLWLVGDSVFPGQSTLATALGGVKTAQRILQQQPLPSSERLPSPTQELSWQPTARFVR